MSADGRRALVLGATGHLGNAIVRDLLAQGWRVTAATRQTHPPAWAGPQVEVVHGDIEEAGRLASWMPGHDWVMDAAAPYPLGLFDNWVSGRSAAIDKARRRTTMLLDAVSCEGATLGYVSSYTTLSRPRSEGVVATVEAQVRRRAHPYFAVKSAMEAMVVEAARGGLRAAIVNPTACLGPWDRRPRSQCVVPLLVTGQLPVVVAHTLNVIDVRDVAVGLRMAMTQRRFGVPTLLAGHDVRTDALARHVCTLAGASAPRLRVPARAVAVGAWVAEAGLALIGQRSPMPSIGQLLMLDGYAMSVDDERRASGVQPMPLDQTLTDAIAWYRTLGYC